MNQTRIDVQTEGEEVARQKDEDINCESRRGASEETRSYIQEEIAEEVMEEWTLGAVAVDVEWPFAVTEAVDQSVLTSTASLSR